MEHVNRKLLSLALQTLTDGKLKEDDRVAFARDHKRFVARELTFRELIASIKSPSGTLKAAMEQYYDRSTYRRPFK